jgi:hypothetical protein
MIRMIVPGDMQPTATLPTTESPDGALDFLKDATNAILVGPNGVGKSTLARDQRRKPAGRKSFPPMRQQAMQVERFCAHVQSFEVTHHLSP